MLVQCFQCETKFKVDSEKVKKHKFLFVCSECLTENIIDQLINERKNKEFSFSKANFSNKFQRELSVPTELENKEQKNKNESESTFLNSKGKKKNSLDQEDKDELDALFKYELDEDLNSLESLKKEEKKITSGTRINSIEDSLEVSEVAGKEPQPETILAEDFWSNKKKGNDLDDLEASIVYEEKFK